MGEKAKLIPFRRKFDKASERRRFARITEPVEALVSCKDPAGGDFQFKTRLENLSAGGFLLLAPLNLRPGDPLNVIVRLSLANQRRAKAPTIAARCIVRRTERISGDQYGLAVEFLDHHFI